MQTIKITPQELRDAAEFLSSKKEDILQAVNEINSKIQQTTENWSGAAQSSFLAAFEQMLPIMQKDFPDNIAGIGEQLKIAADAIETADEEVAKAFGSAT